MKKKKADIDPGPKLCGSESGSLKKIGFKCADIKGKSKNCLLIHAEDGPEVARPGGHRDYETVQENLRMKKNIFKIKQVGMY